MTNRLGFVAGESPVHALHFWEPVIDGRPLRSVLTDSHDEHSLILPGDRPDRAVRWDRVAGGGRSTHAGSTR